MTVRKMGYCMLGLMVGAIAYGLTNNNFFRSSRSRAEFEEKLNRSYTAASEWMQSQERLENVYLIHMVQNCALLSGDGRLRTFVQRVFAQNPEPAHARLIDPSQPFATPDSTYIANLPDYERWVLHAISRKEFYLTDSDRAEMFHPDKQRTGRATHQLLALTLYRQFNGETPALDALIRRVSERIAREAALDFRVTDLYLQRIAFLLAAGQPDLVQPRWVERALAAQEPSGGWHYCWYGWHPRPYRFEIEEAESAHATAQGLWLTCMLKYRYPEWIAAHYR